MANSYKNLLSLLRKKQGEQENLIFMWVFLFIIVALVIAGSVSVVYSENIDSRNLENRVFYERVYDCLVDKGVLKEEVFDKDFDIFEKCSFDKNVFEEVGIYYFNLGFYNSSDSLIESIEENHVKKGDYSFKKNCEIDESETEVKKGPACFSKKGYFVFYESSELKKGYFELTIASDNQGERVSSN